MVPLTRFRTDIHENADKGSASESPLFSLNASHLKRNLVVQGVEDWSKY